MAEKEITDLPLVSNAQGDSLIYINQNGKMSRLEVSNLKMARWWTQGSAPTHADKSKNDYWIDSLNGNKLYKWNGSQWEEIALSYGNLSGVPTLGTASGKDTSFFATKAQGDLADTAVQPEDLPELPSNVVYVNSLDDLPDPSGGNINLFPSTTYIFTESINIGANTMKVPNGCKITGLSNLISGIHYNGGTTALLLEDANVVVENIHIDGAGTGYAITSNNSSPARLDIIGCSMSGFQGGVNAIEMETLRIKDCDFIFNTAGRSIITVSDNIGRLLISGNTANEGKINTSTAATLTHGVVAHNIGVEFDVANLTVDGAISFIGNMAITMHNFTPDQEEYIFSGNEGIADYNEANSDGE